MKIKAQLTGLRFDQGKIRRATDRANRKNLFRAAASIRLTARRSIRRRKGPSRKGTPPHTHTGRIKKAIMFAVESNDNAVIGPTVERIGQAGGAHEHGERFKGDRFDKRPFMGPALEKMRTKLPKRWQGSVK